MSTKYTLDSAIQIINKIKPTLSNVGVNIALTGSVLYNSSSQKDIDLYLYPHDPKKSISISELRIVLKSIGFKIVNSYKEKYGSDRVVDITEYNGYRIDIFLDQFRKA